MASLTMHAPPSDRVRANTWPEVNERLDRRAELSLRAAAGSPAEDVSARIERLDREWDFDRVLETEAALTGLLGLVLGVTRNRRLLILPGVAASMMLLHAVQGWYPLLALFRRMSVRTRDEIDKERYALKAMRGDFDEIPPLDAGAEARAAAAWRAVSS